MLDENHRQSLTDIEARLREEDPDLSRLFDTAFSASGGGSGSETNRLAAEGGDHAALEGAGRFAAGGGARAALAVALMCLGALALGATLWFRVYFAAYLLVLVGVTAVCLAARRWLDRIDPG